MKRNRLQRFFFLFEECDEKVFSIEWSTVLLHMKEVERVSGC